MAKAKQGKTLEIAIPRYFKPLLGDARYKGIHGGRASSKSHTVAEYIVAQCIMNPGIRVLCTREVQKSINQSVKRLIEDKIEKFGASSIFQIKQSEIVTPGNGLIMFQGLLAHTIDSIKSIENISICWIEEAQTVSQRSLDILRPTIFRKKGASLICTWNPRDPKDPIDQLLRANPPKDAIVVQANYTDNPHLPDITLEEIEYDRGRDMDKFRHVWLGEYLVQSEASVFKNWRTEYFDTPDDARFLYGADWGFSKDPTTLVRSFVGDWKDGKAVANPDGRCLFVDYEAYKVGCTIEQTPALFDTVPESRRWPIRADSARPETIDYMRRNGFPRIVSASKGKNSVHDGIEFLKSYDIIVHERCKHVADELLHYKYKVDPKTEEILPELEDGHEHCLDGLRYSCELIRKAARYSGSISTFGPKILDDTPITQNSSALFLGPRVFEDYSSEW